MPYAQQTWSDNNVSFPVSAARMQHIEAGLGVADANASQALAQSLPQPVVNGQWVKGVGGVPVWAAITPADIAGYPADATKFLRGDGTWAVVVAIPVGGIIEYGGTVAPAGFVMADGASYPRTGGTYDALFAVYGTTYGAVDGAHFSVPDKRGRVAVGLGTNASVNNLGVNDGQAVSSRRPHHQTTKALAFAGSGGTTGDDSPDHAHFEYSSQGGGGLTGINGAVGVASTAQQGNAGPYTAGASARHQHAFTPAGTVTGSVGTNVGADAVDTPSFIVMNFVIKI